MSRTPEETFRRLIDLMLAKDMNAVAELWAPDGIAEFPFAAGSSPRVLRGREEVRAYLAHYPDLMDMKEVAALTVRPTEQTDTVVVEWTATGRTVATSQPYRLDYIVVLTVRDGLITLYRDYWSPLSTAAAAGGLAGLLDSFDALDSFDSLDSLDRKTT
ncbi:nuclear transport factor 2 family protein [Streptomyces tendae]|uniref:nuclear transport factor 2 family protein n=1 Tax=Streptomyces tendae TaxID=1932 RepID=UPI00368E0EC8